MRIIEINGGTMKKYFLLLLTLFLLVHGYSDNSIGKGLSGIYKNSNILYLWCQGFCSFYLCNYTFNDWNCPSIIKMKATFGTENGYLIFKKITEKNGQYYYNVEAQIGNKVESVCKIYKGSVEPPSITISTSTLTLEGCTYIEPVQTPSNAVTTKNQYNYKKIKKTVLLNTKVSIFLLNQPLGCGKIIYNYTTVTKNYETTTEEETITISSSGTKSSKTQETGTPKTSSTTKVINNTLIIKGENQKSILCCCNKKTGTNSNEYIPIKFNSQKAVFKLNVGKFDNTTNGVTKENNEEIKETIVNFYPENGIIDYKIGNSTVYIHIRIDKNKGVTNYEISYNSVKNDCSIKGDESPKATSTNTETQSDKLNIYKFVYPLDFGEIVYNYTNDTTKNKVINNSVWYIPNSNCLSLSDCGKSTLKQCKPIELADYLKDGDNKIEIQKVSENGNVVKITIPNTIYGTITFDFENNKAFNLEIIGKNGNQVCKKNIGKTVVIPNTNLGNSMASIVKHENLRIYYCGHEIEYNGEDKSLKISSYATGGTQCNIKNQVYQNINLYWGYNNNKGFYYMFFNDSNGNTVFGIIVYKDSIDVLYNGRLSPDSLPISIDSANGDIKIFKQNGKVYFVDGTVNTPLPNDFCSWVNQHNLYVVDYNGNYYFALNVTKADFVNRLTSGKIIKECKLTLFLIDQIVYTQTKNDNVISNVVKVTKMNPDTLTATVSNYDPSSEKITLKSVKGCPNLYYVSKKNIELTCNNNKYEININGNAYKVQGIGTISTINGETVAVKNIIASLGEKYAKGVNVRVDKGSISIGPISGAALGPSRAGGLPVASSSPIKFPYTDYYYYIVSILLVILFYKKDLKTRAH